MNKNPKKLFLINFFNNMFWLSSVVTFFYLQRNLNYAEIFILSSIMGLSIVLLEIPTGTFADKFGYKSSLLISSGLLLMSMGIYVFANNFFLFALAFVFSGAAIAFSSGTSEAFLFESLSKNKQKNMRISAGRFYSAEVLAGVISPPIASIIAKDLLSQQFMILIILTLISYLIGFIITLTLKNIRKKSTKKTKYKVDIPLLKKNKSLLKLAFNRALLSAAVVSYVLYLWQPQLNESGIPISLLGVLLAVGGVELFFINVKIDAITKIFSKKTILLYSAILVAIGFSVMALIFNPILAVFLYFIIRGMGSVREPIFSEIFNKRIPTKRRATMLSIFSLIVGLVAIVTKPLVGYLADIDLRLGLIFLAVLAICAAIFFRISEGDVV